MEKFTICVYTEYSNNDIADVYTFETSQVVKHVAEVGAYMLMRSIKSNGFGRGKVGIVNLSFYSKDDGKYYLYQMVLRKDGFVDFIKPNAQNWLFNVDSERWKTMVAKGFEFCINNSIVF